MRFRIRVSEPTGGLGIRSVLSIFVGPHRRSGRDNPIAVIKSEIAFVRSLSSKKERAASGLFVAEGEKLVGEMLASEFRVRKIFRCGEEDRSEAGSVDTERVSPKEMERISALKTPTPVLALIELPRYRLSAGTGTDDLALALDGVQDPGNVGTLLRSAAAFGYDLVLLGPGCAAPFSPKTLRSSMGAAGRLPVLHVDDLPATLQGLRARGVACLATALYNSRPLGEAGQEFPQGLCVVIGSEGQGLTDATVAACDLAVRIPMTDQVESLNAGVAGSVLLWQFRNV